MIPIFNIYRAKLSKLITLHVLDSYKQIVIITDDNIHKFYSKEINEIINHYNSNNISCNLFIINNGENSKSLQTKKEIEAFMFKHNIKRINSCLIALGGGVVGDLTGFVASTYKRGIDFIQIPTTLLAMVDSSIGGKTGINNQFGKNLIGTFYNPKYIFIFMQFIDTLPKEEIINGFAEIIKTAAINNKQLWNILIKHNINYVLNNKMLLEKIIKITANTKMYIVKHDSLDTAVAKEKQVFCPREYLNFGHTIGHIIEYSKGLKHGYAVAIGMVLELLLKEDGNYIVPIQIRNQITECIRRYELPTMLDEEISVCDITKYLKQDKKDGRIVLIKEIGKGYTKKCNLNQIIECMTIQRILNHEEIQLQDNLITYYGPGSKSETNRVLILASLGQGICTIKNALLSDDTVHMVKALQSLGIQVTITQNNDIIVVGKDGNIDFDGKRTLFVGNSGTSIRFLTALMLILKEGQVTLTGVERMKERPIGHLISALKGCGVNISADKNNCYPPIQVQGTETQKMNEFFLDCSVSSQYLTGILMVAPSLITGLKINILNDLVSSKFIEMTIKIMNKFGLNVKWNNENETESFCIPHQKYKNPSVYDIEADASSCSYPIAYSIINKIPLHIPNLTSNNTQGDLFYSTEVMSRFGKFVLTCDETGTKISDYQGELKGIGTIDMDSSDTFLTIGVLAALSKGTTKIINIDNQNVKECERINVLYRHLKEAGIDVKLENLQLEINGKSNSNLNNLYVKCHHDHRIAMSLSLLNNHMNKLIISDYTCVNKTYPNFWKDMTYLGLKNNILPTNSYNDHSNHWNYKVKRPIILIGMPCSGKSYFLDKIVKLFSLNGCDTDILFRQKYNETPENFVKNNGWELFRKYEYKILLEAMQNKYDVISTGGGIIENKKSRELLKKLQNNTNSIIIYIDVPLHIIKKRYDERLHKAPYGISLTELYQRRKPHYEYCSNYKFKCCNHELTNDLVHFHRLIQNINEKKEILPNSFFVCIPFNQIRYNFDNLKQITSNVDALELRVDYCKDIENNFEYIENIIDRVQKIINIPLILTVRSKQEWGYFDGNTDTLKKLINLFQKLGVEYIDHELRNNYIIPDRKHVKIIGSCHTKDIDILKKNLINGYKKHKPDIIKVVVSSQIYQESCEFLSQFNTKKILIAVDKSGSITRVTNRYLTPVTSDLIESTAPGQLTYNEISSVRKVINVGQEQEYYLLGFPIQKSPSPFIHNYVFKKCNKNSIYERYETNNLDDVLNIFKRKNFYGASVTMPFKEKLLPFMNLLSDHAKKIGAINTIIKTDEGLFVGDNTDWLAIRDVIIEFNKNFTTGTIIGNGGTARAACYALNKLNIPCNVYCRNEIKAQTCLNKFSVNNYIENMNLQNDCELIIICVPPKVKINFNNLKPNTCIINMAYSAKNDKLIKRNDLNIIEGFTILYKQAYYQYNSWNVDTDKTIQDIYKKAINLF